MTCLPKILAPSFALLCLSCLLLAAGKVKVEDGSTHWSLQPVVRSRPPAVKDSVGLRDDIDRFILARLETKGLRPLPEAGRRTLIRRLSFVVLGLPPAPERVEQFVNDPNPKAYEKLVDEFLNSPHFGERWARHWMDVVRYADTHGTEHDAWLPHAWRYRDYLIRAFNDDLPYDQFVREHIAGDLLAKPRWNSALELNESLLATAWWRFVEFNQTPVDVKGEEVIVVDNQIDALSKAFLGLTVSCARCHDHKFDPISQRDFHGLYSILASTRTTMRVLDPPEKLHAKDAELARRKGELRAALAVGWRKQIKVWPDAIEAACAQSPGSGSLSPPRGEGRGEGLVENESLRWRVAFTAAETNKGPLAPLLQALASGAPGIARPQDERSESQRFMVVADFANGSDCGWFSTGGFARHSSAGDFSVAASGSNVLGAIYPAGRFSHLLSDKHPGTFRSPNFTLTNKFVSALVTGDNSARVRLVIENFQGDSLLFTQITPKLTNRTALRWVTLPVREHWRNRRAYLELVPRDDMPYAGIVKDAANLPADGRSAAGIRQVVFHDSGKAPRIPVIPPALEGAPDVPALVAKLCESTRIAVNAWAEGRCDDSQALWLNALLHAGLLANDASSAPVAGLIARLREVEASVPIPTRVVGVADEAPGFDEAFFPRGDHLKPGDAVPRHFLGAFKAGKAYETSGSGRRELADDLVANPLLARVMMNRLWHHVFGAGLVRTTDNFGKLGEQPSHPELLDWLASEFAARGWSAKAMLRLMLTSEAFRCSSEIPPRAAERDAENRLLSHAHLRRLDAESLRDTILAASGRLDLTMFGPSAPVPIPPGQRDDYTPVEGPLDGRGRRSLYLEVRRNHPSPFLLAFDQPKPVSPAGRREPTNVPAQGLSLLNDPFVLQQAEFFAQRALAQPGDVAARVRWIYNTATGRAATDSEISRAAEFLAKQAAANDGNDMKAWRDLAHAVFNLKEFLYLR